MAQDLRFLNDTFNLYYEKGMEAKQKRNYEAAKRNLLLAAETLLKMAKASKGELQKSRLDRANRLIELADRIKEEPKEIKYQKYVNQDKGSTNSSSNNMAQGETNDEDRKLFHEEDIPDIGFDDVAGLYEVKEAINNRIIQPLAHPEVYKMFNKKSGGGIILYGPPGTGKTMIAKAIAHEVGGSFFAIKCSDIVSKWFGEAEQNVAALFEQAAKCEKAVIFFDEFEALGSKRGDNQTVMNRLVPELLAQIQGFNGEHTNILLLAATNRPWDVDSAFLRPGRFNQMIYVPLPDFDARKFMIEKSLKNIPIDDLIDFNEIATKTDGFNGSDVCEFCERMKDGPINRMIKSGGKNAEKITYKDFLDTLKNVQSSAQLDDLKRFEDFKNKEF